MLRHWLRIVGLIALVPVAALAQKGHSGDVISELPIPEIYLQPVKYIAHTGTTTVALRSEQQYCNDSSGNPLSPCLVLPYVTENSTWRSYELATVVLPRKSLREVLAFAPRFGPSFTLRNHTPGAGDAFFQARLVTTLESPAIPNGSVSASSGDRFVMLTLQPGARFSDTIHYTRDGMINRQWLIDNAGMTAAQVDQFFDSEITLRFTLWVRGVMLDGGSVFAGVLMQGY